MAFPGGSVVKNPPTKQEIQVRSLGGEDPLEKEMENHSSGNSIDRGAYLRYSPLGHKELDRA